MSTFLQSGGSARRRAKNSDNASAQLSEQRRLQAAVRTREALDAFEEGLTAEQRRQSQAFEDLPSDADAANPRHNRSSNDSDSGEQVLRKSASEPTVPRVVHFDPLHARRPPSPLGFYDYGCVSMKPRSMFGQHRQQNGESVRPKHRHTSCGFYSPGPQFKQGPYGFSVVDPCLMPPKVWESSKSPSHRTAGDAGDMRPLVSEEFGHKRSRKQDPVTSDIVRATGGHTRRAQRLFHCLDNKREEAVLEQARFEQGVFEGKWRNPLLDTPHIDEHPPEQHDWIELSLEEMTPAQQTAADLLFRIERVSYKTRGRLAQLFVDKNGGHPGVLEPEEFISGLIKLRVCQTGELKTPQVISIMSTIDPGFNGRVNLPTLSRAVNTARGIRMQREQANDALLKQRQVKLSTSYSESIPVDVIKVDRYESSLLNFNRSFQKFLTQQRGLLEHHNEALH